MKFIATRLEIVVAFVYLWICAGILWPPTPYFSQTAPALDASDPAGLIAHTMFLGVLLLAGVFRRRQMLLAMRCSWPILMILALAFLSAFWSDAPELVLRRAGTLAVMTLFAMYLAARFEMPQLVSILVKVSACGAVVSFVVIAVAPGLAYGGSIDYPNAIRGAFTAKNTLGGISAMGIVIAAYAFWRGYGSRLISGLLLPANMALVFISVSATALILIIVGAYAAVVTAAFRLRNAFGFTAGFALTVIGFAGLGLLGLGWQEVLLLLNRDATLTGRAEIWQMSSDDIAHRPWLGFGYGAFWRHDTLEARTMWEKVYWIVPHAHNGLLEIGLALGIIGMIAITVLWVIAAWRGIRVLAWPSATHVGFCLAIFAAVFFENLTEFEFLKADSLYWSLFTIGFVYLGREAMERRAALGRAGVAARVLSATQPLPGVRPGALPGSLPGPLTARATAAAPR
ncbi:MAG: O-antigen ligase family protein [Alphaproteobacteria bacterium]|nr:O-antigen ligase family protein [Alphaproteobacteria bacterium]